MLINKQDNHNHNHHHHLSFNIRPNCDLGIYDTHSFFSCTLVLNYLFPNKQNTIHGLFCVHTVHIFNDSLFRVGAGVRQMPSDINIYTRHTEYPPLKGINAKKEKFMQRVEVDWLTLERNQEVATAMEHSLHLIDETNWRLWVN